MLKLVIIGNVGKDATIKEQNGKSFCSFSVAVNESYKNAEGQKTEKTTWVNCFINHTHGAIPFIKKGCKVYVEGSTKMQISTDQNQQQFISVSCNVVHIELLSSPSTNTSTDNNMPG